MRNKNRDDLIEAGKELFLKYGLLQVKIKDVCTKAELSRVTFYKHFQSMDELLLAIQMQLIEHLTDEVSRTSIEDMNGREQLTVMLNAWVVFAQEHPDYIRFIQLFDINYEMYDFSPELREQYDKFNQNGKEKHFLMGALSQGVADGSIKNPSPPLDLAQFIFTTMMGMLQRVVKIDPSKSSAMDTRMTEQFVKMLLHFVCSEETPEG
ncbi:TetR/AcrR family transcriptional regulator [Paenibacillus sp. LS1]|nr:TetR/AcrR family transcriptional regulator [Paenibacillus sp. LS1]